MRRQIVASQRAGESVTRVAERLLEIDSPIVELPEHVRDLRDAARMALESGDRNLYEEAVERWAKRVKRLGQGAGRQAGEFTMRSATQQMVKDLRKARDVGQVDEIVNRWTLDRARHQARVIARTETVEAYRDGYRRGTESQPYTVGYRWTLSGSHPKPDVCDVMASQDLHGLGPGGYPPDGVPSTPHPLDLCSQVAIIDSHHFRRQVAHQRGEEEPPRPWESGARETGEEWLRKQPEQVQRQLLGPTRHELMRSGVPVLRENGTPIPVHELQGRPPPSRARGETVRARRLVERDRASMVQPFPAAPTLSAGDTGRSR